MKADYVSPAPSPDQLRLLKGKRVINLAELVRMKRLSNRRKDQVRLLDMIGVGLIDATWSALYESP